MSIYVDKTYLHFNPTWDREDSVWKAKEIFSCCADIGILDSLESVCEIGCGAGGVISNFVQLYGKNILADGYDISPDAIAMAKSLNSNVNYYVQDLLELDKNYDIGLCVDVFEHVENYLSFLRLFKDKARYKVFRIPMDMNVLNVVRQTPLLDVRMRVGHIHYFNKRIVLQALTECNYNILHTSYSTGTMTKPNYSQKSAMLNVVRRSLFKVSPDFAVNLLGRYSLLVIAE